MSRRAAITQAELVRTLKAFQVAGIGTRTVEIDHATGKILVTAGGPADVEPEKTALEAWRASRGQG